MTEYTNKMVYEQALHLAQIHDYDSYEEYLKELDLIYKDLIQKEKEKNEIQYLYGFDFCSICRNCRL